MILPNHMRRGFSLIELVLTVALISIVTGVVMGTSLIFLRSNDLDVAVTTAMRSLRRAQILSTNGQSDTPWGVKLQSGSIMLFQGSSFALRNSSFDEVNDLPMSITPSGITEVVFAKTTGTPSATGIMVFTHESLGPRQLVINALGMIEYETP